MPKNIWMRIRGREKFDDLKFISKYWNKWRGESLNAAIHARLITRLLAGKCLTIGGVLSAVALCFTNKKGEI